MDLIQTLILTGKLKNKTQQNKKNFWQNRSDLNTDQIVSSAWRNYSKIFDVIVFYYVFESLMIRNTH